MRPQNGKRFLMVEWEKMKLTLTRISGNENSWKPEFLSVSVLHPLRSSHSQSCAGIYGLAVLLEAPTVCFCVHVVTRNCIQYWYLRRSRSEEGVYLPHTSVSCPFLFPLLPAAPTNQPSCRIHQKTCRQDQCLLDPLYQQWLVGADYCFVYLSQNKAQNITEITFLRHICVEILYPS